jgi:hypothetical protein
MHVRHTGRAQDRDGIVVSRDDNRRPRLSLSDNAGQRGFEGLNRDLFHGHNYTKKGLT